MSANDRQVGGDHYAAKPMQPWDYIAANGLGYFEGNVVKYVSRWRDKGGVADLEKAAHYLQKLIELEKPKQGGLTAKLPTIAQPPADFLDPVRIFGRVGTDQAQPSKPARFFLGDRVRDGSGRRGIITAFGLGAPPEGSVWVQFDSGLVDHRPVNLLWADEGP